ncbi:alpha/beta hydrolase [Nocardia sp. NBC_01503]|uniref:alpha/beta hydrolase n=1 Tax=Nocardia sp. NBC_01503 TaxID=2975997 RepID=UPI002E7B78E5|nr:alpha/beta hydrolase [Nocardia sp. NBC_01503]WTL32419.1 alpha/beta hydrolase [Nocardia sp. NBC_01503]
MALTVLSVSTISACRTSPAATALEWQSCRGSGLDPRQECTRIQVPLDYSHPDGEQITLAVSRIRSAHPESRHGVMLLVPGGPGGPGLNQPSTASAKLPAAVRDIYDLASFDPRGSGESTTADCRLDPDDLVLERFRGWPRGDGDISANIAVSQRIAKGCADNGGALMRSMGTRTEARDMDRVRAALGENTISAWGESYGTYATSVYATLFPERTDRILLDSNDDPAPERVEREWNANYAVGVEDRFPDFARWASDPANPDRVADTPEAVRTEFLDLAARLDSAPLPWPGSRLGQLTGNGLRQMLLDALYRDDRFPDLARMIRAAAASATLPEAEPGPPERVVQQRTAVAVGTICNDAAWPTTISDYVGAVAKSRAEHPLTAGLPQNVSPCTFWPYPAAEKTVVTPDGPSNVLMIQNLRDPATPYGGALNLRTAYGDRARMITVGSGGHGAYPSPLSCANEAVERFLRDGTRPDRDLTCR